MMRQRRGQRKIAAPADLQHDELRHQQFVVAAQDLRRDVVADRQHEGEECADHDAGKGQRQDDMEEGLDRPGAEIGRGLAVVRAELLEVRIDRQRQQHDEEMHEADDVAKRVLASWSGSASRPDADQRAC